LQSSFSIVRLASFAEGSVLKEIIVFINDLVTAMLSFIGGGLCYICFLKGVENPFIMIAVEAEEHHLPTILECGVPLSCV